jgi:hypothetical protein|tara:strand:+ start:341 stop:595 length:255 start_codon:yes stop_codon:yes gene_type:complete
MQKVKRIKENLQIVRKVENLQDMHSRLLDVFQQCHDGTMDPRKGLVLAKIGDTAIRSLVIHKFYEKTEIDADASKDFNLKISVS